MSLMSSFFEHMVDCRCSHATVRSWCYYETSCVQYSMIGSCCHLVQWQCRRAIRRRVDVS